MCEIIETKTGPYGNYKDKGYKEEKWVGQKWRGVRTYLPLTTI
jgi:hypothetical protein